MKRHDPLPLLSGQDRRSKGAADAVALAVDADPAAFAALMEGMRSDDPVLRMRCADAAEKASRRWPSMLRPHAERLVALAAVETQAEVLWHVLQMLSRAELSARQRARAFEAAVSRGDHPSRIVQAERLSALFALSLPGSAERAAARDAATDALDTGPPAVRARARRLLA